MSRFFSLASHLRPRKQNESDSPSLRKRNLSAGMISAPQLSSCSEPPVIGPLEITKVQLDNLFDVQRSPDANEGLNEDCLAEEATRFRKGQSSMAQSRLKPSKGSAGDQKIGGIYSDQDFLSPKLKNEESLGLQYGEVSVKHQKFSNETKSFERLEWGKLLNNRQGPARIGQSLYEFSDPRNATDDRHKLKLDLRCSDMPPMLPHPLDYSQLGMQLIQTDTDEPRSPSVYSQVTLFTSINHSTPLKPFPTLKGDFARSLSTEIFLPSASGLSGPTLPASQFSDLRAEIPGKLYYQSTKSGGPSHQNSADLSHQFCPSSPQSSADISLGGVSTNHMETLKIMDQHAKSILTPAPLPQLTFPEHQSRSTMRFDFPDKVARDLSDTRSLNIKQSWYSDRLQNFGISSLPRKSLNGERDRHKIQNLSESDLNRRGNSKAKLDEDLHSHKSLPFKKPKRFMLLNQTQKRSHDGQTINLEKDFNYYKGGCSTENEKQKFPNARINYNGEDEKRERFEALLRASDKSVGGTMKLTLTPKIGVAQPASIESRPSYAVLDDIFDFTSHTEAVGSECEHLE